ncbi:MAG: Prokaryotic metallothionein [Campylobacterales bacterium]|nr:Prokaryotic metallothionein [Campylobacterales bacterium]
MILKILGLVAVLFLIYFFFFKVARTSGGTSPKKPKKLQGETMLECANCSTFVSDSDAIIKDGQFFCSRECAKA